MIFFIKIRINNCKNVNSVFNIITNFTTTIGYQARLSGALSRNVPAGSVSNDPISSVSNIINNKSEKKT